MKPGADGEIILEGSRDRRYARRAARVLGNGELLSHIDKCTEDTHNRLYWRRYNTVTQSDMTSARWMGIAFDHRFTEFKSDENVRKEIAERESREAMWGADVRLDPEHTPEVLESLEALSEVDLFDAIKYAIRRPVADRMIDEFTVVTQ